MGCIGSKEKYNTQETTNRSPTHKPPPNAPKIPIKQQPPSKPIVSQNIPQRKKQIVSPQNEIKLKVLKIQLDNDCPMLNSYVNKSQTMVWKEGYNWHSFPIKSKINLKEPSIFSVKNLGIKFNHFVVGIIRQADLLQQVNTPWKTEGVLCYYSCGNKNERSCVKHGEKLALPVQIVNIGETLSLVIRQNKVEFWIDQKFQVRTDIPSQLLQSTLLPYIATFCSGDNFQILKVNPLQPYDPPPV